MWGIQFIRHLFRRNEQAYFAERRRTESGFTSRAISKYSPDCPILAVTVSQRVMRKLALLLVDRAALAIGIARRCEAAAFALSPYLFYRSLSHLTLSFYWPLPFAILAVTWAFGRSAPR